MSIAKRQKKKVLQVLYSGLGGHGSVFTSFVEGDEQQQVRHQALFYGIEPLRDEYSRFCEENKVEQVFIQKSEGAELSSVLAVYRAFKTLKPDVIVLHSMNLLLVAVLYCALTGCQLLPVEHTPNLVKRKSEWLWTLLAILLASRVVYLSEEYVQQLKSKFGLVLPDRKAVIIPNGVNTNKFSCSRVPEPANAMVFAMQSRFTDTKDHATLLQGFATFLSDQIYKQNFRLKLAGDGNTLEQTKQLAQNLGIGGSVEFCGMLSEQELIRFLCSTTVYIHCSLAETSCTSVMQAMACGLPVLASNIPGIKQLFNDGVSGKLLEPKNPYQLSACLTSVVSGDFRRSCTFLGSNARAHAMRFHSHTAMFTNYAYLWKNRK